MTAHPILSILLALAATLPAYAAPAITHDDGVNAHPGIDAIYQRFHEGYASLDASVVSDLYTKDALYLSPQSEMKHGRDEIHQDFVHMFESADGAGEQLDIRFRIVKREVREDLATDVGYFTLVRTSADGENSSDGKFVVVAERDAEGTWRFSVDGYSSNQPWKPSEEASTETE